MIRLNTLQQATYPDIATSILPVVANIRSTYYDPFTELRRAHRCPAGA